MLRQQTADLIKGPCLVVDLEDDLSDQAPMLVSDSGQDIPFALLDVHFQQVNPRDTLLVNNFGKRSQAAWKRHCLEL